jgi:hypothetical protein
VPRNYLLVLNTPYAATAGYNLAQYSFVVLSKSLHIGKDGIFFS